MKKISVTVLTKNSEETIEKMLDSATSFDEVILLDTGSTDRTLEIAAKYKNVKIYHHKLEGFGESYNKAVEYASNDWVFTIDSDEEVSESLKKEIFSLNFQDPKIAYRLHRHNYLNGKYIYFSGWGKDFIVRLYNKNHACFQTDRVHAKVDTQHVKVVNLKGALNHYPYRTIGDFLHKMQQYTTLYAEQNQGKKKSSFSKALIHAFYAFFRNYFFQLGFLGGEEGYFIAKYNAQTAYYKYLKLREYNKKL